MRSFLKSFRLATEVMVESLALIGYPDPPVIHFWASWQVSFFFSSFSIFFCFSCIICLLQHSVWKFLENVSFNIASVASYVYILLIKNAKKCPFWASFWKPEACGQTVLPDRSVLKVRNWWKKPKIKNSTATFWVIFKQCATACLSFSDIF